MQIDFTIQLEKKNGANNTSPGSILMTCGVNPMPADPATHSPEFKELLEVRY